MLCYIVAKYRPRAHFRRGPLGRPCGCWRPCFCWRTCGCERSTIANDLICFWQSFCCCRPCSCCSTYRINQTFRLSLFLTSIFATGSPVFASLLMLVSPDISNFLVLLWTLLLLASLLLLAGAPAVVGIPVVGGVLAVAGGGYDTLMKKKIKFSSYIRKFRWDQVQSHIWGRAS